MVKKHTAEGFDEFKQKAEALSKEPGPLFVYFSGSEINGKSWCPDCVTAKPVVVQTLEEKLDDSANFLYVGVGGRDFWKDPNCIFRKDASTKLNSVPTLFKWGNIQERLEEGQCAKPDMITMLFED